MLPRCQRSWGKALFNAIMPWTWAVEQGEVTLGDCTLRADLVGPIALGQRCVQGWPKYGFNWGRRGACALSTLYD